MLINIALLAAALILLTAGAEFLVRGASTLARRMGLSSFFIGLTIVGFGTSTPELATSVNAGINQLSDISLGNIIGSNIFNIAFILGLTAMIAPIPVNVRVVRTQVLIMIAVAFIPLMAILADYTLTRWMGVLLVGGLVAFLAYGYYIDRGDEEAEEAAGEAPGAKPFKHLAASLLAIAAGLVMLVLGSQFLIHAAVDIAQQLGVSELAIGLTIVAGGTSMPELFTSLVAALRKQADISIGNIVGSNIFNILGIGGITAALYPQSVSPQLLALDTPLMIALSLACLPIMLSGHRISRAEGALFLGVYLAYMVVLFRFAPQWF